MIAPASPKFSLGQTVITANALATLPKDEVHAALRRHRAGDWGDVDKDDWKANETSLAEGLRLLSVYHTRSGIMFWIITEWDRSVTTVLLPEDY